MKRTLSKEEFEKLPEIMKAEYEEKNGKYLAKIEDDDDAVNTVLRAKQHEIDEHKGTKAELAKLKDELESLKNESNRKNGNVEALENSYKEKIANITNELGGKLNTLQTNLAKSHKETILSSLASKLAKTESHRIFKKGIEDRIQTEFNGETTVYRILDKDGKPSAMTIEDFEKEIVANKEFGSILIGSKASGSSGPVKPNLGGSSANPNKLEPNVNLGNIPATQLADLITAKKTQES